MYYYQIIIEEKDGIRDYGYCIETDRMRNDLSILSLLREQHVSPDALSMEDIGRVTQIFQINAQDYKDYTGNPVTPSTEPELPFYEVKLPVYRQHQRLLLARTVDLPIDEQEHTYPKGASFQIINKKHPPHGVAHHFIRFFSDVAQFSEDAPIHQMDAQLLTHLVTPPIIDEEPPLSSYSKRKDILIKPVKYPGVPATYQQAIDVHTDEPVPYTILKGSQIVDAFTASNGDLVMTLSLDEGT